MVKGKKVLVRFLQIYRKTLQKGTNSYQCSIKVMPPAMAEIIKLAEKLWIPDDSEGVLQRRILVAVKVVIGGKTYYYEGKNLTQEIDHMLELSPIPEMEQKEDNLISQVSC